jgi:hypothetical protein
MNYFELAKILVRMHEVERTRHGDLRASEIERLPQADLPVLLRPLRSNEPGVSGDDGVPQLL